MEKLQETTKAMKSQMVEPFMGKGIKAKKGEIMDSPVGGLFQVSSVQRGC